MSASAEKKNRRAAREAGTDKKTLAAEAEAKKQAKSKLRWTLGTIGVLLLIAAILFLNTTFLYTSTTALTVAGEKYSPAQVSYRYANQFFTFANQYGSYASIFGLDTSGGLTGLRNQSCPMLEDGTWRDYFLESAQQELIQTKALCDYAAQNGISLTQEEIDEAEADFEGIEDYAKSLGYSGAKAFLSTNYGRGVTPALAMQIARDSALASKAYAHVYDSTEYSSEELEEHYQSLNGDQDVFDFAYYYAAAETVESEDENGETVSEPTEETLAAAKTLADTILASYEELVGSAEGDVDYAAALDSAVAACVEGGYATHPTSYTGSSLGAYADFLKGDRSAGDADVVENSGSTGYYVVVFLSRDDNHYPLAQVRHILVMAEADEDGTYSDEAKAAAKARAEEILQEWKDTDPTEDYFATLAEVYSDDGGSNTNGGLYDAVFKGQMVPEFDAFCFEGHQPGDTGIVYGESGSYAGYHVMYYVGEGEQYSDYIARTALLSEDMNEWLTGLTEGYEATPGFGMRFVG